MSHLALAKSPKSPTRKKKPGKIYFDCIILIFYALSHRLLVLPHPSIRRIKKGAGCRKSNFNINGASIKALLVNGYFYLLLSLELFPFSEQIPLASSPYALNICILHYFPSSSGMPCALNNGFSEMP